MGKAVSEILVFEIFPNHGDLNWAHPRPGWMWRRSHRNHKTKVDYVKRCWAGDFKEFAGGANVIGCA